MGSESRDGWKHACQQRGISWRDLEALLPQRVPVDSGPEERRYLDRLPTVRVAQAPLMQECCQAAVALDRAEVVRVSRQRYWPGELLVKHEPVENAVR